MKTLRLYGAGLLVALLLTLAACVPSTSGPVYPDYTLDLIPTSLTVQRGSSGTTRLIISSWRSSIEVNLRLVGAPRGVRSSFTESKESKPSRWIVELTVSVDRSVAPGTYNLQVLAIGRDIAETLPLSLTVTPLGTTWTLRFPGFNDLNDVAYGNGTFVAVGRGGTILTSPDGVSWRPRTSGTSNDLYGVTYGNGRFVAVGEDGTILTSPDGVNWTERTSGTGSYLYSVAYGNGNFVAVGADGPILTSPDGVTWTPRASGTGNPLRGVTYGNGLFVTVGYRGTILTSPCTGGCPPPTTPTPPGYGKVRRGL
jgi:hypothetical protein